MRYHLVVYYKSLSSSQSYVDIIISKDDVPSSDSTRAVTANSKRDGVREVDELVYAARPNDDHSFPHVHRAEQVNFVLKAKSGMFVEDEAVLLEPGDFHRVPGMAVHWAKVEGASTGRDFWRRDFRRSFAGGLRRPPP